jgi:hypothetical protein
MLPPTSGLQHFLWAWEVLFDFPPSQFVLAQTVFSLLSLFCGSDQPQSSQPNNTGTHPGFFTGQGADPEAIYYNFKNSVLKIISQT